MNTEKHISAPATTSDDSGSEVLDDSVEGHVNQRPLLNDGGDQKHKDVSSIDLVEIRRD